MEHFPGVKAMVWGKTFSGETLPRKVPAGQDAARIVSVRSGRPGPHARGASLRPQACDSTTTEARATAPGWSLLGVPACDSTATVATTTRRSSSLTASVATA